MTPERKSQSKIQAKFGLWRTRCVLVAMAGVLLLVGLAGKQAAAQDTPTLVVFRPAPAKTKKGQKSVTVVTKPIEQADIGEIKIGGKVVTISAWTPLLKKTSDQPAFGLQLVVLLDSMEQIGINEQFSDMKKLFDALPSNVEIAVGYLLQGKSKITQPFTTDRKLAGDALHEPQDVTMPKNDNGSPYQCLKDLAAHWPDPDPKKLRAVLMFTDGIDRYNNFQGGDQQNPDVDSAQQSLQRAGIMPFPFYYMDPNVYQGRSMGGQLEGQANFDQLTTGAQGFSLYEGQYSPASFDPLLNRFYAVLNSMAVATINLKGSGYKQIDVKPAGDDVGVIAPDGVTIGNALGKK